MRLLLVCAAVFLCACSNTPEKPKAEAPKSAPPKILIFYPNQNIIGKGEKLLICYGVEDAASVSIDPPVEQLKPSFNRCFEHVPTESGKYTLKATGKDGSVIEQSFEVKLEAARARTPAQKSAGELIHFFTASKAKIRPGEPVMLCYEVAGVGELSLTPSPGSPLARPKGCVQVTPQTDTTYKLTARGTSGASETDEARVRVQP